MKKFAFILSGLLMSLVSIAQTSSGVGNTLKLNVFGALGGSYTLVYERVLNEKLALQLSVGYRYMDVNRMFGLGSSKADNKIHKGFTFVPELKYYITNTAIGIPEGLYVAPFARIGKYTVDFVDNHDSGTLNINHDATYTISAVGGGILIGYQFIIAKSVALDLFFGPQFKNRTVSQVEYLDVPPNDPKKFEKENIQVEKSIGQPGIRAGFTFGIAF
ncbi:MAG: DUF3575 domain-containing protein [Cytophagaceae bacterium]